MTDDEHHGYSPHVTWLDIDKPVLSHTEPPGDREPGSLWTLRSGAGLP
ncbi:hypothetical protein [Streptomyces hydrogenans]